MKKIIVTAILAFILLFICFSQNTTNNAGMQSLPDRIRTGNEGFASDEFRRGVQSYNKGAFSEAIVQFEKALSYLPNDNLILDTHVNYENECDSIDYVISEIEKMYDFTLQISKVLGI